MTNEIKPVRTMARNIKIGVAEESFEQKYQRALVHRLSVLPDEAYDSARQSVDDLIGRIGDPQTADNIKADLVFRVLDGVTGADDFNVRLGGYAASLERRNRTFSGEPIFKPASD